MALYSIVAPDGLAVPISHGKCGMPKQPLQHKAISTILKPQSSKGVSQQMRINPHASLLRFAMTEHVVSVRVVEALAHGMVE